MKRNAFFQLIHKEDGVYLKSYPAVEGGEALSMEDIFFYLDAKKIPEYGRDAVKHFIEEAAKGTNAEVKISSQSVLPENEFAVITVDPKNLYAKLRLYPNSNKGKRLTVKEILDLLDQKGVKHGINPKNIEIMLKARLYCCDVLVAAATMPVHGKNAEITYHFNIDKTNKPTLSEDGSVDFHKLDMIEPVEAGQHLATLLPADMGQPGIDVRGNKINAKKVIVLKLKHGKNIHLSDDGLEMYSDISGNVSCVNGMVFVADSYEVPADVGPSTGDINYDGNVNIKGNVLTGYSVNASGDIYVSGAVEGAVLQAGGKIVINRGIQGMGKAKISAQGDVISNFIESAEVSAGGKIITDAIMHSEVTAKDDISVNGKRGMIAGGSIRSTTLIEMKTAGSTMGTVTELEVGIDPDVTFRYHEIEKTMEELADEKDKLEQNIELLMKRYKLQGTLEVEKLQILKDGKERLEVIDKTMDDLSEEYDRLEETLANSVGTGKVVVYDKAYSGVKITISNITKYLHSEAQHSTFVRDGADIRIRGI